MKRLLVFLLVLTVTTGYSQSYSFCNGWDKGFERGYCKATGGGTYGCVAPPAPPCGIPDIGEDNYSGGYDAGYEEGMKEGRNEGSSYGTSSGSSRSSGAYTNPKYIQDNSAQHLLEGIEEVADAWANNPAVWNNKGIKKYSKGDYNNAASYFTKAISLARGDQYEGKYYFHRGQAFKKLNLDPCPDYKISCQLRCPEGCSAYDNFCKVSSNTNQYNSYNYQNSNTVKLSDNVINMKKNTAYHSSGAKKLKLKDYYGAIADFSQAIKYMPKDAYSYKSMGIAKYHLGDYNGSVQDLNKSIELESNNETFYYWRGAAKEKLNQEFCADYKKSCDLGFSKGCDSFNTHCK